VLGAAVPLRLVLVRTDSLAIAITDVSACPSGFESLALQVLILPLSKPLFCDIAAG
jgi:hypothetical protein